MMEATSTSEMSVNFYQVTQRTTPEVSHLQKAGCSLSSSGDVF
jgi:hypothetical protein